MAICKTILVGENSTYEVMLSINSSQADQVVGSFNSSMQDALLVLVQVPLPLDFDCEIPQWIKNVMWEEWYETSVTKLIGQSSMKQNRSCHTQIFLKYFAFTYIHFAMMNTYMFLDFFFTVVYILARTHFDQYKTHIT